MNLMNNLFSSFDPSNFFLAANWALMIIPIMILSPKQNKNSKASKLMKFLNMKILKEILEVLSKIKTQETAKVSISLFLLIASLNLWSLIPSSFTLTAQISANFPIALSLWLACFIFSSLKKTKNFLSHLVPMGTPIFLMPLMVAIEMISNIIRPLTLAVRLTANMIAGHILISLAEELALLNTSSSMMSSMIMMTLLFLETGVAIIQAFIFTILISLFSSENH